ncbi:hypothetical protein ANCDUO_23704 [Ancylostoma duodenale]|uniref:Uncharacterized protein n=1 Tax=Ancylostoma duodenale TaxID=51022 RepID=A0A0C2FHN2_9BILA|nr:hypothetical protein ANCDUO_23704 [Ancylostoma duodenale]
MGSPPQRELPLDAIPLFEMENSNCGYPSAGIFDEIPWMPMPPAYYAYPVPGSGQPGYPMPMAMPHSLPYPTMANWYNYATTGAQAGGKYKKKRNLFTKLQLNMLQRSPFCSKSLNRVTEILFNVKKNMV